MACPPEVVQRVGGFYNGATLKGESMELKEFATELWKEDFTSKPYGGCTHQIFNGVGGSITISLLGFPFTSETESKEIHIVWEELMPESNIKSLNFNKGLECVPRSKSFLGDDKENAISFVRYVEDQIARNRWMLHALGGGK